MSKKKNPQMCVLFNRFLAGYSFGSMYYSVGKEAPQRLNLFCAIIVENASPVLTHPQLFTRS